MINAIGELLGRIIVFLQLSFLIVMSFLIPLLVLYFFSKVLIHLFQSYKKSLNDTDEVPLSFIKTKITFTIVGILYNLFIFSGLIIMVLDPPWFNPPIWFMIVSIVLFVPYFACVLGFMGLGNIGRAGFSPWKDFKSLINEIKN